MDIFEKQISTREIYQGRILALRLDEARLPNGQIVKREVVHHNGGVAVLAVDREDRVLFVRQFRYPYGEQLLELPAGKLEPGEDPAACGLRELEEETGYTASDYSFLGRVYPTPGYVDEVLHLYLAKRLAFRGQRLDENEFLSVEKIPFEKAVGLCLDGGVTDAKTLVAILKYSELRRRGEQAR